MQRRKPMTQKAQQRRLRALDRLEAQVARNPKIASEKAAEIASLRSTLGALVPAA